MAPIGSQPMKTKPDLLLSAGCLFMFKLGTRRPGMKNLSKKCRKAIKAIHNNK